MSAKENTKLLLRTLRNNLFQGRCHRTGDLRRPWLPSQGQLKEPAHPAQAKLPIQYRRSKTPVCVKPTRPMEAATMPAPSSVYQRSSQPQSVKHSGPHYLSTVSVRNELWRMRASISALQRERRALQKQLNRYKDKLRAIYTTQEEKCCRFETKIQELRSNQDSLWSMLQQMGEDVQAMLQPPHPSCCCQHMVSKAAHSAATRFRRGRDSSQITNVAEDGPGRKPLPAPALVGRSQANTEHAPPDSQSPASMVPASRAQSHTQNVPKKAFSSMPSCQQGLLQGKPQIWPVETASTTQESVGRKGRVNITGRKDELEEEELQGLLSQLMDAFNLEMPSGSQSSVNADLYSGAERVCRAFSALVDQITFPACSEKEPRPKGPLV